MAMSGPVCRHIVRRTGQVCGRLVQYEDHACGFHTQLTVTRSHQHRRHGHGESSSGSGTRRRRRRSEPMGTQQQQPARSVRTRTTAADETPANHHPIPPPTPAPTGDECTICYTVMEPAFTRWLPCGHAFHDACIGAWENTGRNLTCPLCRAPIHTPTQTPPPSPPAHYYDDFAPLPGVRLGLQHTPVPPAPPAPPNGHEDGPRSEGDHHTTPTRGDEGVRRVLFQSPTTSSVVEIDEPVAVARSPVAVDVHTIERMRQMIEETVESTMRRVLDEYIPR